MHGLGRNLGGLVKMKLSACIFPVTRHLMFLKGAEACYRVDSKLSYCAATHPSIRYLFLTGLGSEITSP